MRAERATVGEGDVRPGLGQRVAFATGIQVVGKLVVLAVVLLSTRLITNYLGVDAFGDFAIVLTGATLTLAVGDLGIAAIFAREISRDPTRTYEIAGNLLFLRLVTCGAIMVLALVTIPFLPFPDRVLEGLVLAVFGALLGVVSLFPAVFFQVHLRLGLAVVVDVATRALALVLIVFVVLVDGGFLALVVTTPIAWAFGVVIAFWLSRQFWRPSILADTPELRRLIRAVAPLSLVITLGLVHFKVDSVMLAFLKPAADVGIYVIAYSVVEQSLILPSLFMAAVFPILARLVHAGDAGASDVVQKSFRLLVLLGFIVAVATFTLAVPFVRLVSNADYSEAVAPMRILALAIVPLFAGAVFVGVLVAVGELRWLAIVSAAGIVVNVGLNAIVIPRYSYNGAAVTTVLSEAVVAIAVALLALRTSGVSVDRGVVVRLSMVGLIVCGSLAATSALPWWSAAPVALGICVGSAFAFGAIQASEVRALLARRTRSADGAGPW